MVKQKNKKKTSSSKYLKKNKFYAKLEKIPPFSKNKKKYTAPFVGSK
jgi:hypothetical protein